MYVGDDVSPDFYGWVFPKYDHVGVGTGTVVNRPAIKDYQVIKNYNVNEFVCCPVDILFTSYHKPSPVANFWHDLTLFHVSSFLPRRYFKNFSLGGYMVRPLSVNAMVGRHP